MKSFLSLFIILEILVACSASRTEALIPGDAVGCGHFQVFLVSANAQSYIRIALQAKVYGLKAENTFVIGENEDMQVEYKAYSAKLRHLLCNDVRGVMPPLIETSLAAKGRIVVRLTQENLKLYDQGEPYLVDIEMDGMLFENGMHLDRLNDQVLVGWLPG